MNDNLGGAPNPLNTTPIAGPLPNISGSLGSPDPMNRPMEQVPEAKPASKKGKIAAIVGIILAGLVIIGGGIAAALIAANMNKKDVVADAMSKIMRGEAPSNVVIDGDINIAIEDELSPLTSVNISLNSGLVPSSFANNSVAKVTVAVQGLGDFTLEFDEIYAGDGDLYFKIDGINDALEQSGLLYLLNHANEIPSIVDCGEDDTCSNTELREMLCTGEENCVLDELDETSLDMIGTGGQNLLDSDILLYLGAITDNIDIIDGNWLKISLDDLNDFYEGAKIESDISCITTLVSDINTNSNSAAELYTQNPFIISVEGEKTIESKKYPVYQIGINNANFANFTNSIQNPILATDLYTCLGWHDNIKITEEDAAIITRAFPTVFAEIDESNNFSRLYLESELTSVDGCSCEDGAICDCAYTPSARVTMDLNFSYPVNISIPEPEEYTNFAEVIQKIMSGMFNLQS